MSDPRFSVVQASFAAGMFSPSMHGRIDLPQYRNAAADILNMYVLPQGSLVRRQGTERCCEVDDNARVIMPFIYNDKVTYTIVAFRNARDTLDFYIYDRSNLVSRVVTSDLPNFMFTGDITKINYVQSADVMIFTNRDMRPFQLRRTRVNIADEGEDPVYSVRFSVAYVPGLPNTEPVEGDEHVFNSNIRRWYSPSHPITTRSILTTNWGSIKDLFMNTQHDVDTLASEYDPDSLKQFTSYLESGTYVRVKYGGFMTDVQVLYIDIHQTDGSRSDESFNSDSFTVKVWFIGTIAGAYGQRHTTSTSSTSVSILDNSSSDGNPNYATFFQQRLWLSGFRNRPNLIRASKTGDFFDFSTKDENDEVQDDSGLELTIDSDEVEIIEWIRGGRVLEIGTFSGIYTLGEINQVVSPTNVLIKKHTSDGVDQVRPIGVGRNSMYVDRSGTRIRELEYSFDDDGYITPDITLFVDGLFNRRIRRIVSLKIPDQFVWVLFDDGAMAAMTYDKQNKVYAWTRQELGGDNSDVFVEDILSLPTSNNVDELYLLVRRGSVITLERMRGYFKDDYIRDTDGFDFEKHFTDSGNDYTSSVTLLNPVTQTPRGLSVVRKSNIRDIGIKFYGAYSMRVYFDSSNYEDIPGRIIFDDQDRITLKNDVQTIIATDVPSPEYNIKLEWGEGNHYPAMINYVVYHLGVSSAG